MNRDCLHSEEDYPKPPLTSETDVIVMERHRVNLKDEGRLSKRKSSEEPSVQGNQLNTIKLASKGFRGNALDEGPDGNYQIYEVMRGKSKKKSGCCFLCS